ncbi:MAG: RNA methyltransferase [Candidatus Margulisiibacteriota bacterium]
MKEKLKLIKNLLEKRSARRKEGLFVVEGPHLVAEAADQIKFILYAENLPLIKELEAKNILCFKVSKEEFSEISEVEAPQWVLAVVKMREYTLEDLVTPSVSALPRHLPLSKGERREGVIVFCHEIQDPGNLGTIIRTADAAGASGIILSKGTVDLYNSKTIRSTMGSLFHLPIVEVEDVEETLALLKNKNIKSIAASLSAQKNYFEVDYKGGVVLVVGNEGAGLSTEIIKLCDETVKIPMPGKAESLNVGISTAVILYEALRQRFAFSS